MKTAFALAVFSALQLGMPAHAGEISVSDTTTNKTIVFVCLHGSARSQMAAAFFNKIAGEQGLPYVAVSRSIEVNGSIPVQIRDGLRLDGLAPLDDVPRLLTPKEAAAAVKVVSFDGVPDDKRGEAEVRYWLDVPPATADYFAARDVIVRHVNDLLSALAKQAHLRETLRGVITARDERHDTMTVHADSGIDRDFKVRDGLTDNAIHCGDFVEITVENIGGMKTIVGLKKLRE